MLICTCDMAHGYAICDYYTSLDEISELAVRPGRMAHWNQEIMLQVYFLHFCMCYDEGKKLTGMTFEYASRKCACLNCSCNFAMRIDGSMRPAAVAICDCTNG